MRNIFILVPSLHPSGPIKGAIALANALVDERRITLVTLKKGPGANSVLDSRVKHVSLADKGKNILRRLHYYQRMLKEAGGRVKTGSISLCLSADIVNLFCRSFTVTCTSVRGNLPQNYRLDYGPIGIPLAMGHLTALRCMDHVVTMTAAMANQVAKYIGKSPAIIGNFVDETALECYRDCTEERHGPLRFVFLASLSIRKRPELLINAMIRLRDRGIDAHLDIIGDGPLKNLILKQINRYKLDNTITLHGHLSEPYSQLACADVLVLPSLSEGLSRAVLEALHLGVVGVLRDSDGNDELVTNGVNGVLFKQDNELPSAMLEAANLSRKARDRISLLPSVYRQKEAARSYLELVESI